MGLFNTWSKYTLFPMFLFHTKRIECDSKKVIEAHDWSKRRGIYYLKG